MALKTLAVLTYKKDIDTYLRTYIYSTKKKYGRLIWSKDVCEKIAKFVVSGKTVRGSLVVYTYTLFQKNILPSVWNVAGAMELLHAGLLIHDDIMDRDTIRRGMPTMHSQYEQFGAQQKGIDVAHFGLSQAINIADFCYFLGYKLASVGGSAVTDLISTELSQVVLAQMQDVSGGHVPKAYTQEDVLELYRYKTARYTFSLPMRLGALLAKTDIRIQESFEQLGECLGLLFQIRDDEFDVDGDSVITGKSLGIDAINKKQTLAHMYTPENLEKFRRKLRIDAQTIIRSLPIDDNRLREFMALLHFCEERNY